MTSPWDTLYKHTTYQHASLSAEADLAARSANTIRAEDIKIAHNLSRKKLAEWLRHADKVLEGSAETVLNASSPSFAHHLVWMLWFLSHFT